MLTLARPAVDVNNNPLGWSYTAAQVDAALHAVNRSLYFRFAQLDKTNKFIKLLQNVTGGAVTYDYTQQIKRTAQFDLVDDGSINFLTDRIQPFALLKMSSSVSSSGNLVVYYDSRYALGWMNNPTGLVSYLNARGFETLNADELGAWMTNRINSGIAPGSVVVNAMGVEPDTIVETEDTNNTLRKYLNAGGRFVHAGDVQLYYQGHNNGTLTNWASGGSSSILQVGTMDWGDLTPATITSSGSMWGMLTPDDSNRGVPIGDVTVVFSEIASAGSACSWLKNFNSTYATSGFIRYRADQYDGNNSAYNADVFALATYSLPSLTDAFAQFPLGVFLLSTAPRQTDDALVVTRQVQGYDLNQILVDTKTTDRYTIAAGTNYISAVSTLLNNAGITATNLTSTTATLQTALDYKGGTPYLTIVNDLLTQINYKTLWFDANGTAVAQPWTNPSQTAPGYTYQDDSNSVTLPAVNINYDLFNVPNEWVVCVAQTDQATIVSTYTNTNANSPTSTVNRGRTITHFEQNLNAPLSQTLASFAERLAFEDSQVYETVVYETAIMPFHEDYDVVDFIFSALGISDNFSEVGWSFPLAAGATMSHTVRKVVPV